MKKFEVILKFNGNEKLELIVEARNLDEAHQRAKNILGIRLGIVCSPKFYEFKEIK
ncbi:hypothetical protein [Clostridium butyricum]